jgi:Na+/citrate or Na+/malate symporter
VGDGKIVLVILRLQVAMVRKVILVDYVGRATVETVPTAAVLVVLGSTVQRIKTAIPEMHPVVGEEEDEHRGMMAVRTLVVQELSGKS